MRPTATASAPSRASRGRRAPGRARRSATTPAGRRRGRRGAAARARSAAAAARSGGAPHSRARPVVHVDRPPLRRRELGPAVELVVELLGDAAALGLLVVHRPPAVARARPAAASACAAGVRSLRYYLRAATPRTGVASRIATVSYHRNIQGVPSASCSHNYRSYFSNFFPRAGPPSSSTR